MNDRRAPIPMILHCPKCHVQHVDAPEWVEAPGTAINGHTGEKTTYVGVEWKNPPHRSHLCHACGIVWRPADVATTGVASIATRGRADTWCG